MARLIAVNVGFPRDIPWRGETVHTAIWKEPVADRRVVRRLNIDGDGQGDLAGHGGEHRAVMVYQLDSYRHWEQHLGRHDFKTGQFGENFTVDGLSDEDVCVGDRYRIGSALFEVTQPRVTCYRIGIRMGEPQMPSLLVSHHRPGFYFRVLEEGDVGPGDEIFKCTEGPERVTVAEMDALLYLQGPRRDQLERALRVPALSQGWKGSLQAIIEQSAGLSGAAVPPLAWQGFRSLRVARVDRESASIRSFSFANPDGSPLPAALPGQFLVLKLRPTSEGPLLLRNYSMSGPPGSGTYRVSVKQEPYGAASTFLHHHVNVGDTLDVSAPRGSFTLLPGEQPVVLLSVGVGATPVLAMLHSLAAAQSMRQVWWVYGARTRNDHPFAEESRLLLQKLPQGRGYIAYSQPGGEDELGRDYDVQGHLSAAVIERLSLPQNADFYLCGPPPFLKDIGAALKDEGVAGSQIHAEIFGPEESFRPGIVGATAKPVHPPEGTPGTGPQVSFTRSGLTVPWSSQFESLLELAEACDVPAKWSCRTGVCHTCECGLLDGTVHYEPDPLLPPAGGNTLICCSKPNSDIELDL